MIKRNGFLVLMSVTLAISLLANVYSFNNKDVINQSYISSIEQLQEEVKDKEKEIKKYKNTKYDNNNDKESNEVIEDEAVISGDEELNNDKNPINNSVKKFIEYAFSNDEENYATRKKLARNYMMEELYEGLFSADGLNEEQLVIKTRIEEVEVFSSYEDNEKLYVRYTINESKADDEYNETIVKHAIVKVEKENGDYKVSEINALSIDDWGI